MHIFDESFWLAICFIAFIYLAYRPVRRAMLQFLDSRIEVIKAEVTEAEDLKKEAAKILQKTERELSQLESTKARILEEAKAATVRLVAERTKEMELALIRLQKDAEHWVEAEKKKAYHDMQREFIQTATRLAKDYFERNEKCLETDIEIARNLLEQNRKPH